VTPRPRRPRAAAVALAVLVASVALLLGGHPLPAAAQTTAQPLEITVTELSPLAPTAADTVHLAGRVTNSGDSPVTDLIVQLRVSSRPLLSRSALAASASNTDPPPGSVAGAPVDVAATLAPGASGRWQLDVPGAQLALSGYGVYPMAVEARATRADGSRARLGTARTFLTWGSDTNGLQPTRLAVLWPVLATPAAGAGDTLPAASFGSELNGRLTDLVTTAAGEPVSWVLDGDLLESAGALADGGPLPQGSAIAAPDPAAARWLASLKSAVGTGDVNALAYADPDAVAVTRAGLTADLKTSTALGPAVVRDVLGRSVTGDVAWPAEGTADAAALGALNDAGVRAVVLSDVYTPTSRTVSYTPSAVGPLENSQLTALVTDRVLSALLATPAAQQGGAVLARQRFLSELAMITAERPFDGRAVVVAPPRYWQPEVAAVRDLLSALGSVPWVQPQTVQQLRAQASPGVSRRRPSYPTVVARREVSAGQLDQVRVGRYDLQALTSVLSQPQPLADQLERGLLRAESTAWRERAVAGTAFARSVSAVIAKAQAGVRIVPSGPITLTSRSGQIPITVANDLDQAVTVRLDVAAVPSVRMTLSQPGLVTVGAGRRETVEVQAKAAANGRLVVQTRLLAPDGQVYGPVLSFPVRATGIGQVAQWVVGGALVLLTVALSYRIGRAIRRGRHPGPASDGEAS
jgi:hypothetical protein